MTNKWGGNGSALQTVGRLTTGTGERVPEEFY